MNHACPWPRVSLGTLAERIDYGITAAAKPLQAGAQMLRITDIQDDRVNWGTVPSCECSPEDLVRYALGPGDIVFARTGATTGKSFLVTNCPPLAVFASYLIRVRPGKRVLPRYLAWFFQTADYWQQITASVTGTAQPGVNSSKLRELSVPVPEVAEQERIAAILDKADAVRRKRKEAIALTEELLRSAFLEMFGDPVTNPKGWPVITLSGIAEVQGGLQVTHTRDRLALRVPYLRVANVHREKLSLDEIKHIGVTPAELERARLRRGDMLVVEGHGNIDEIGRVAVWDGSVAECVHQNHLIRVRVSEDGATPVYVSAYLNSEGGRRQMREVGKTTSGLNTISTNNVRGVRILLPPVVEQHRYERLAKSCRSAIDKMRHHSVQVEVLFSSLVHRAFRGEL